MFSSSLILAIFIGVGYAALPLPSYVTPCARSDPGFDACATKSAQETIKHIINGDSKYKIPAIDPLEITEIAVPNQGSKEVGIDFIIKKAKIHGFKDTIIKQVKINYDKKRIHIDLQLPRLEVLGNYEITGRILLLPINGKGALNVTLVDTPVQFDSDWTLHKKDGREFMSLTNYHVTNIQPKKVHYDLQNLFNGDKVLGPEMNNVLNQNWKEAFQELSTPVVMGLNEVIASIVNNIADLVEYDNVLPLKV